MNMDAVQLEVFKNRLASVAEEMGVTLTRTGYSPNIKERRDLSCAVFDHQGEMVAQAAHIPVHLGSMPLSVQAALKAAEADGGWSPGDMMALNDPFAGGTHLPDITLVAPVFHETGPEPDQPPAFFVANRAHHADVGGMAPGSMPLGTSIFQEGLIIPPLRLVRGGSLDRSLLALILRNVRTPAEREGDLAAQVMANATGARRMGELMAAHGVDTMRSAVGALADYAETLMRRTLKAIPDGRYEFEDFLDDDGAGNTHLPVRVTLTVEGDEATADFTASADQTAGGVNAVRAITLSAVLYVLRCLGPAAMPANAGCLRPMHVVTRPGSILDARFPAAVAGGNVETSQRVVDVLLGALAKALPQRIPAASQGTMNNVTVGGIDPRTGLPFAYYETLAGGAGAGPGHVGADAVHTHMTNTLNTPAEALEYGYPFLVRTQAVRRGSGGTGARRGGNGLVREVEVLAEAEITVLSERRTRGPWGLAGGEPGAPGRNVLVRGGREEEMPGKFHARLQPGDRFRLETPGGGGHGARKRDQDS